MAEVDKLFSIYESGDVHTYILAKTRKEALENYKEHVGYKEDALMGKEEKTDWNQAFAEMSDVSKCKMDKIIRLIAEANEDKIVSIPQTVFQSPCWEEYFGGKFFYGNRIKLMSALDAKLDELEKYARLKKRLIHLAEYLKENNADTMI
jgi:hypothetical protein